METSIKSRINSRVLPVQQCFPFLNGSVNLALEEAAKSLVVFKGNIIQTWQVKTSVLKLLSQNTECRFGVNMSMSKSSLQKIVVWFFSTSLIFQWFFTSYFSTTSTFKMKAHCDAHMCEGNTSVWRKLRKLQCVTSRL